MCPKELTKKIAIVLFCKNVRKNIVFGNASLCFEINISSVKIFKMFSHYNHKKTMVFVLKSEENSCFLVRVRRKHVSSYEKSKENNCFLIKTL